MLEYCLPWATIDMSELLCLHSMDILEQLQVAKLAEYTTRTIPPIRSHKYLYQTFVCPFSVVNSTNE